MSKDKKRLVPVRRFKEFENAPAWEQRKLGDVVNRFDNLRIPVTASKRIHGEFPYYGANGIQDYVDGYTHNGEYILVAEDGASNVYDYPVNYVKGKVWVNNHAHVIQGKTNIADNLFLLNAIKSINIASFLVGGSRAKLNAEIMMELPIKIPSYNEQKKIGKYFANIDSLITLHQRKLDKLKRVKSAYLTEMFPAEGEREPKRRFPGFTVAWEQRKLTEIVNRVNKSSNSDVLPKVEFEDIVSGEGRLNKDISSKLDSRKGTLFESENILYGKLRPYLKNWLFPDFEGVALGDFWVFEATDVSVPSFDYYLIQSDDYQKVANDTSGTKMPRSDWKNVSSTDFAIPSKDEQKQIGAFFKQLDDTITLHQRKLDKLKKMKAAYLEEMFV